MPVPLIGNSAALNMESNMGYGVGVEGLGFLADTQGLRHLPYPSPNPKSKMVAPISASIPYLELARRQLVHVM